MFVYRQSSPIMTHNGVILRAATLYSGHGSGLNNPAYESMANVGPIPAGLWRIVTWHDTWEDKGPIVAQLEPVGFDPHDRSGFLIHGPHANDQMDSSHGCIVASRELREKMREIGDTDLSVVSISVPNEAGV